MKFFRFNGRAKIAFHFVLDNVTSKKKVLNRSLNLIGPKKILRENVQQIIFIEVSHFVVFRFNMYFCRKLFIFISLARNSSNKKSTRKYIVIVVA